MTEILQLTEITPSAYDLSARLERPIKSPIYTPSPEGISFPLQGLGIL
jgi:hypothetical protein